MSTPRNRALRSRFREDDVSMGHEATVSKVSEDQLFLCRQRGLDPEKAVVTSFSYKMK